MTQHPDIHRNDLTVKIMEDWTPRRLVLKIGVRAFFLDIQDDTKEPGRMEWYLAQLTNAIKSIAEPHQGPPPLEVRESAKCGYCGGSGSVNSWTTATSIDICFKCNGAGTATAKGE